MQYRVELECLSSNVFLKYNIIFQIHLLTRTFKFRLYPTFSQHKKLHSALNSCRWVYNKMVLKIHNEGFQSRNDLNYFLTELKEENVWLYQHHSKMLQMISTQLHGSQRSLQELKKNSRKTGDLKFALYHKYNTFVYNQSGFNIKDNVLHLSKIGNIKMVQHREMPNNANVKQIAISRQAYKWYAAITFVVDVILPLRLEKVGIDVGIRNFAYDSNGQVVPNPLHLQNLLKSLARIQRKISRKQKGSQNRKKAIKWYQRIHQRIANRRKDFCHKISSTYAAKYGTVYLEKLNLTGMVRNRRFARKILDSGWGIFSNLLEYKTNVVQVPANNTTIDCSRCGTRVPKTLAIRIHVCNACGLILDRDYNAAINILNKGILQELQEFTPVEISMRSMNQEEAAGFVR